MISDLGAALRRFANDLREPGYALALLLAAIGAIMFVESGGLRMLALLG